jgi:hypothetical protein
MSEIPQGKKKNGVNIQKSVLTLIVLRFRGLVVQRRAILMVVVSLNKLQKNNWLVANGGNSGWKMVLNTPIERDN